MEPPPLVTILSSKQLSVNKAVKIIEKFIAENSSQDVDLTLTNTERTDFISDDTIIKLRSVLAAVTGDSLNSAVGDVVNKKRIFSEEPLDEDDRESAAKDKKVKKEKKDKKPKKEKK
jgi:hypothetical protein